MAELFLAGQQHLGSVGYGPTSSLMTRLRHGLMSVAPAIVRVEHGHKHTHTRTHEHTRLFVFPEGL